MFSASSALELSRSKNAEIAKHVIHTEEPLNVADLEVDGRFGKGPVSIQLGYFKIFACIEIVHDFSSPVLQLLL